jgi:hypothetical protein
LYDLAARNVSIHRKCGRTDFERAQNDAEPQYLVSPAALATNLPTEPADPSNKYAKDVFSGSRACVGRPRASGV